MTSLFDLAQPGSMNDIPVDLITRGGRGVMPLEFFVIEGAEFEQEAAEQVSAPEPEFVASERAKQTQAMIDAARADAIDQARRGFELELDARLHEERVRVERACAEFAMDRQRYFAAAEGQVVKLAIAVARRILAREVEADAMHLTATVRAALARVHDGTSSVLRVRSNEVEQWSAVFADAREGSVSIVADERLAAGECVLETEVGRVELGVQVQLAEVERGFRDLLRRQGE